MPQSQFSRETVKIIAESRAACERARSEMAYMRAGSNMAEMKAAAQRIIIESHGLMAEVDARMARR